MADEKEKQALLRDEMEKTFWQRFFIQLLFCLVGSFLAHTLTAPLLVGVYGWANAPRITHNTIVRDPYDGKCMGGVPAKVIRKKLIEGTLDTWSDITLQRGKQPAYICRFMDDTLYKDWQVGEWVFHKGGWRR